MQTEIGQMLIGTLNQSLLSVVTFVPKLLSGLIVLLLGIIIASFLKQVVIEICKVLRIDVLLKRYGVPDKKEGVDWISIFSELVRWSIIILFLIPVSDVWGLGKFVDVLNGLLVFLPNLFVAMLLLVVGFVISKLVYDLLLASLHDLTRETSRTVATVGKWSVLIFVFLVVLTQLGIASDLIKILFAGFVAMLSIAGGLAFGLGGKEMAREVLEKIKKRV